MRRKIPVEYRMVEPTLADRKRDLKAIGSSSHTSTHPLLVARYAQFSAKKVQGSKGKESDKDPESSRPQDQHDGGKGETLPAGQPTSLGTDRSLPTQQQPGSASTKPAGASATVPPAAQGPTTPPAPDGPSLGAPRRNWEDPMAESFTPLKYKDISGPLNDVHVGSDHGVKAGDIADRIKQHMPRRFDTRFVEFHAEEDEQFLRAVEHVKGEGTMKPVFEDYLKAVKKGSTSKTPENQSSKLCTAAFNAIAEILAPGEARDQFFTSSPTKYPSWNPALKHGEGHGERPAKPSDMDQWHKVAPDVTVWKDRTPLFEGEKAPDYHWGKIACTGEMKVDSFCDMRTEGAPIETSGLQILKYLSFIAYENPVTGFTCGFTICGGYMRMWISDSLSFATSRLCDLSNPDHAAEIVTWIAFMIGPLENVIDTFEIPRHTFTMSHPSTDAKEPGTVSEWEWIFDETKDEQPWCILERRRDLWGRRTVCVAGQARKKESGAPTESLILKFIWAPAYLSNWEYKVLEILGKVQSSPNVQLSEALQMVKEDVLKNRPRPVGMLGACERRSRRNAGECGTDDGIEPSSHSRLHLSCMCTINAQGQRISIRSELSISQRVEILSDGIASLWVAACNDIHYRDVNAGNIVYLFSDQGSEEVTAFLIDYGNARILDEPRLFSQSRGLDPEQISELAEGLLGTDFLAKADWVKHVKRKLDDARSGNAFFISTQTGKIHKAEVAQAQLLRKKKEADEACLADPKSKRKQASAAALGDSLKSASEALFRVRGHRYIDDLESLIYVHIWQVSEIVGEEKDMRNPIRSFSDQDKKSAAWDDDLQQTLQGQQIDDQFWIECIGSLVQRIKQARKELESDSSLSASLSQHEHSCFRDCIDIVAKRREEGYLGTQPLKRPPNPYGTNDAGRPAKRQKKDSTMQAETYQTW